MRKVKQMLRKISAVITALVITCTTLYIPAIAAPDEDRAQKIISDMTLKQKIAQMFMISLRDWENSCGESEPILTLNDQIKGQLQKYGFGGVVVFKENMQESDTGAKLICAMQNAMMEPDSVSKIPLLISADQEGGYVYRLGSGTVFGGNMALAATGDVSLARNVAAKMGEELDAIGINLNFGPDMDVNSNQSNPVIGVRSFSDDPQIVSEFGKAYIEGLRSSGVGATIKHFPGHGDTDTDSHTGLPRINKTYEELRQFELIPFQAAIDSGVDMVMTAHIQFPQIEKTTYTSKSSGEQVYLPATMSKTIITDILRRDMGFDGVVCTDSMAMQAITDNFSTDDALKFAINAGVDIMLMQFDVVNADTIKDYGKLVDKVEKMVRNGEIPENRINESAKRIIQLKINRGLMDKTFFDPAKSAANALRVVGSKANHDFEWESVKKAVTLVKNNGMLPVKATCSNTIAFFAAYDDEVNSMQFAVDRLRSEGLIPAGTDIYIESYRYSSCEDFRYLLSEADYVFVNSETYSDNYMNSGYDSGWQARFIDGAANIVHSSGNKIAVISSCLPYDAARYTSADAFLLCYSPAGMNYYPREYNGRTKAYGANIPAAVCIAFGESAPTASLPVTLKKLDSNAKATCETLYPIGCGLTYSSDPAPIPEPKPEQSSPERSETRQSDPQRSDTQRSYVQESDVQKSDAQKSDIQKSDAQKSDIQKSDAQKSDIQKSDIQKSDAQKSDTKQSETEKSVNESSKAEISGQNTDSDSPPIASGNNEKATDDDNIWPVILVIVLFAAAGIAGIAVTIIIRRKKS